MQFTTGIYKIVNRVNGKYYVGSSTNALRRWKNHVGALITNKHVNDYLQNAWNKYGASCFDFVIVAPLASTITQKELLAEEQKWLDVALKDPLTYNLTFVAGCPTANMSDYAKRKRSKSLKKVVRTPEWKAKISKSHMGLHPTQVTRQKMSLSHTGVSQTKSHREAATESRRKHWDFISPSGEMIHIYDLTQFCREKDLHPGLMGLVFRGRRRTHKGWTSELSRNIPKTIRKAWCKSYTFLSPGGERVHIENLKLFSLNNKLDKGCMYAVHLGQRKSYRGWMKA